jgi:hypothetical protein
VPHPEVSLEHVADLAVLLQGRCLHDLRQGGERLAGSLLDVGELV